jgi:hypothetical protein
MDKRIVGLAIVSLILATLIMVTIARERIDQPIEIIQNEFPEAMGKSTFKFAVVARQKFEDLRIRFTIMWQEPLAFGDKIDPQKEYNSSSTAEDVLGNSLKLSWLANQTALLNLEPEKYDLTVDLEGTPTRMVIHDYSAMVDSTSGRESILGSPLIYAAIVDENGEEYYLEGISGFFVNPTDNILSLRISHNDQEQHYTQDDQIWEGSGRVPVSEAPTGGILDYSGVDKDDRFNVVLTAEPRNSPKGFGGDLGSGRKKLAFIEVIRIYADGELYGEPIINVVEAVG